MWSVRSIYSWFTSPSKYKKASREVKPRQAGLLIGCLFLPIIIPPLFGGADGRYVAGTYIPMNKLAAAQA